MTVHHNVLLNHAFSTEDDVAQAQHTRATADLVACLSLGIFPSYSWFRRHVEWPIQPSPAAVDDDLDLTSRLRVAQGAKSGHASERVYATANRQDEFRNSTSIRSSPA